MIRNLSKFWFKVVFLSFGIFFGSIAFTQTEEHNIELCNEQFVIKKYSVLPLPGYNINWILDPQLNIQNEFHSESIFIKWENVGSYILIVQYSNGECISQNELTINISGCPEFALYIPSAFTPNSEGTYKNELFGAYGLNINEFHMDIFNRWGELLFQSNTIEDRWDGYYKNNICSDDIYVYKIRYKGSDNKEKIIYGKVMLIK